MEIYQKNLYDKKFYDQNKIIFHLNNTQLLSILMLERNNEKHLNYSRKLFVLVNIFPYFNNKHHKFEQMWL